MKQLGTIICLLLALLTSGVFFHQALKAPPPAKNSASEKITPRPIMVAAPASHQPPPAAANSQKLSAAATTAALAAGAAPANNMPIIAAAIMEALPVNTAASLNGTALQTELAALPFPRELLDTQPRPRGQPELNYPEKAQKRRIEGQVVVSYRITAAGQISNPRIVEARPAGYFENAALEYLRQLSFSPAIYQGAAVAVNGQTTIEFKLP